MAYPDFVLLAISKAMVISFNVDLYEQPDPKNKKPKDPNLFIGHCMFLGSDLPEGKILHKGDEILINWNKNESGIIKIAVELPSIEKTLTGQFYSSVIAHKTYAGKDGEQL